MRPRHVSLEGIIKWPAVPYIISWINSVSSDEIQHNIVIKPRPWWMLWSHMKMKRLPYPKVRAWKTSLLFTWLQQPLHGQHETSAFNSESACDWCLHPRVCAIACLSVCVCVRSTCCCCCCYICFVLSPQLVPCVGFHCEIRWWNVWSNLAAAYFQSSLSSFPDFHRKEQRNLRVKVFISDIAI